MMSCLLKTKCKLFKLRELLRRFSFWKHKVDFIKRKFNVGKRKDSNLKFVFFRIFDKKNVGLTDPDPVVSLGVVPVVGQVGVLSVLGNQLINQFLNHRLINFR